jgi:AcrR family transcriptional regulator
MAARSSQGASVAPLVPVSAPDASGAEQVRARLLEAATQLYGTRGYAETRVEDIATHAKMSLRTLYAHFRNLADLRFAVYEAAIQRTVMRIAEIIGDPAIDDHLDEALGVAFTMVVETPELARIVLHEFQLDRPRNVARRKEILDFFVGLIVTATNDDHVAGRTPRPAEAMVVKAMLSMFEGLIVNMIHDPGPSREATAKATLDVVKRVYRSVMPWRPSVHAPYPAEFR